MRSKKASLVDTGQSHEGEHGSDGMFKKPLVIAPSHCLSLCAHGARMTLFLPGQHSHRQAFKEAMTAGSKTMEVDGRIPVQLG